MPFILMERRSAAVIVATKLSSARRLVRKPPIGEKAREGMVRIVPVHALGSGLKEPMHYLDAFGGPDVPHVDGIAVAANNGRRRDV